MKRLLIIGCGDVAMRAIPLLTRRYRVFALVRNPAYGEKLRALGVLPIFGDLDDRASPASSTQESIRSVFVAKHTLPESGVVLLKQELSA